MFLKKLIPDLLTRGKVLRPWLGLDAFPVSAELAAALHLPVRQGVLISRISPRAAWAGRG